MDLFKVINTRFSCRAYLDKLAPAYSTKKPPCQRHKERFLS